MALGSELAGPMQPPTKPDIPQGKGFSETKRSIGQLLKSPEMLSFMMQASASMLAGRGLGEAIGDAGEAVGRYGGAKFKMDQETRNQYESDREYQLRVDAANRAAAGGSGGGGGGGGGGSSSMDSITDPDKLGKMLFDDDLKSWEDSRDNSELGADVGPRPDRLDYQIRARTVQQAVNNGMPLSLYSELRAGGNKTQADGLARLFASNPEEGKRVLENFQNPTGNATTPDTSYTPGAPAPAVPSPAMPGVPSPVPSFGGVGLPDLGMPTPDYPTLNIPQTDPFKNRALGYLG